MDRSDASLEEIASAQKVIDDPNMDYWKLSNRLEEMGRVGSDMLTAAYAPLPPGGKVCVFDNIWLVQEAVTSNSFKMKGKWAVRNSTDTGNIQCYKMWDPVILYDELDCPSFQLLCLA